MSRLRFGPLGRDPETEALGRFATDFATSVGLSFPVDETAVDRVRAQVLEAFAAGAASLSDRGIRKPSRRLTTAGLAASAGLMAVAAAVGQSDPGESLYPVRLGIESAMVPGAEDPSGWAIRLHRLQDRMHDGIAAARDGQPVAVDMALTAYRAELSRLTTALAADPGRRGDLLATVAADLGWVEDLQRTYRVESATLLIADMRELLGVEAPPGVSDAPSNVTPLPADGAPGAEHANGNAGGNGNANGNAGGNGNGKGNGNGNDAAAGGLTTGATPAPAATPEPAPVSVPHPTPTPTATHGNAGGNGNGNAGGNGNAAKTPKPEKTAKPDKTPKP